MSYSLKDWNKRIVDRPDISRSLVHMTRGNETQDAAEVLLKILIDKKLIGSSTESGFICGQRPAVCFQDATIYSISKSVYFEQLKVEEQRGYRAKYSPFGFTFPKSYLYNKGARPVFYEKSEIAKGLLPSDEYWRIVSLDLSSNDNIVDWTHEREWRLPGDLTFDLEKTTLICVKNSNLRQLAEKYKDITGTELRDVLRGIVTIRDVLF